MHIGVQFETTPTEKRVAITPETARKLIAAGHQVTVETCAGLAAGLSDRAYAEVGVTIGSREEALSQPVVAVINPPEPRLLRPDTLLIGLLRPLERPALMGELATAGVSAIAFELLPRITRAQSMDALSSQATIAGYQAALEAAAACDRLFPMLTTAAGTIPPARVLVLGAGVAGLQAIATARRLGAIVSGFDVRAAAAEQVRSLGATFLTVDVVPQDATVAGGYARELEADSEARVLAGLTQPVAGADAVITTAAIPGRPAPRLLTVEMVESMRSGSVVVDLAATTGGNCELTRPGVLTVHRGVSIVGFTDLPSRKPFDASQLYSRNVAALITLIAEDPGLDFDDDIIEQATVTHAGEVRHPRVREMVGAGRSSADGI
ncbi:MAG: Re/Si-specific NAD(P)(+) transhydrogenase subunit alpha [Actinomycetota bacterium]